MEQCREGGSEEDRKEGRKVHVGSEGGSARAI